MADLEDRVDKLEEKVNKMELELNNSLEDIKSDIKEIKVIICGNSDSGELKNQLILKDIKLNEEKTNEVSKRVKSLEDNQSKLVWVIIGELVAVIFGAIKFYLQIK